MVERLSFLEYQRSEYAPLEECALKNVRYISSIRLVLVTLLLLIFAIEHPLQAAESRDIWTQVRGAIAEGRLVTAEARLWELLAEDPESVTACVDFAHDLSREGLQSEMASVLTHLGRKSLDVGDYALAETLTATAVEVASASPSALSLLGQARALNRKFVTAEAPLLRAVELGQTDTRTLLYLGSTLWENGRLEAAESVLRRAVATSGRSPVTLHQLGRLLLWQGDFADSAVVLEEVVAKQPATPDVILDLARAFDGAGREEEALAAYTAVIQVAPDLSKAHYGLANLLIRRGDLETGRMEMQRYRELVDHEQEQVRSEGLERARLGRAQDLLRREGPEAAIALLEQLPVTADSLALLATALESSGDRSASLKALEQAVALAPERSDLRSRLNEARLAGDDG